MARAEMRGGGREFYSGKMNERDTFGEPKRGLGYTAAWRAKATESGYLKFNDALELVRKHLVQDPTNPSKPFANELRIVVIDALGLKSEDEMDRVRFYSAIGTPADVFHGVDGWMEYESPDGRQFVVTLDVTKNTEVLKNRKADVVIWEVPSPEEDEEKFLEQAEAYGREVAEIIQSRLRLAA